MPDRQAIRDGAVPPSGDRKSDPVRLRPMRYRSLDSPVGPLLLAGDAAGVRYLVFQRERPAADHATTTADGAGLLRSHAATLAGMARAGGDDWIPDDGRLDEAVRQITEYFAGRRQTFDVALAPAGTAFQRAVWAELQKIPYGATVSYGEIARRVGNPNAVRAVGLANGSNPISIIVPCHRVIGSNGELVGYGGGLPIKQALLALERGQGSLL